MRILAISGNSFGMVKIFTIIFIVTTLQTFGQAKNGYLILHNGFSQPQQLL
jgi:hypothetical protein